MHSASRAERRHDVMVIGSGVGGSMAAHALVGAGLDVLLVERGPRVERGPENAEPEAVFELGPYYTMAGHYRVRGDDHGRAGTLQCVGGPAVFYGAVSYRMREVDFAPCPEIVGASGARWPYGYDDIEPYYAWAERVLGVAGRPGGDRFAPRRSGAYPHLAPEARGPADRVWRAAAALGLSPSFLPLAIDFRGDRGPACAKCGSCDGYACALSAKRDPGAAIIPDLERRGLTLLPDTVGVQMLRRRGRIVGVHTVDRVTGRRAVHRADRYVLAAGAIGSPHLILSSELHTSSPASASVGRYLMRHCNAMVFGLFRGVLEGSREFHKQVALMDFYGGRDGAPKLGCIQSVQPPPPGLVRDRIPGFLGGIADYLADHSTGLLVIAEDQPMHENGVGVHRTETDEYGLARAVVTHRYTWRDAMARRELARVAHAVLRRAGARITKSVRIKTFSHAVGTLRMGVDPRTSPLDRSSRFRGIENLWVTDGSFMPRSAAVNPSLTIAANALMAAESIAERPLRREQADAPRATQARATLSRSATHF